ncbi:hypothetical protein KCP77_02140 [Salmonella enterica subsp. enterica]|nr:hypothetical protein KCP77_02140 [Salmonella enterica subsp. enterica]
MRTAGTLPFVAGTLVYYSTGSFVLGLSRPLCAIVVLQTGGLVCAISGKVLRSGRYFTSDPVICRLLSGDFAVRQNYRQNPLALTVFILIRKTFENGVGEPMMVKGTILGLVGHHCRVPDFKHILLLGITLAIMHVSFFRVWYEF